MTKFSTIPEGSFLMCNNLGRANERPAQFPADVRDLRAWLTGESLPENHPFARLQAFPQGDTVPEVWILGSSNYGAQIAAHFGLPYCFAWFFWFVLSC